MSQRKKRQPTFKSFQGVVEDSSSHDESTEKLREQQIEAVKQFAVPTLSNPYQSLPVIGLSRILSKRLPDDMDGLIQYYNHIDIIQTSSFVEKCRILAHANALFHGTNTQEAFIKEEGSWTNFLNKIGQTRSQVSRYVSFWNVFGETILKKIVEVDFGASKLAELLTWPEDPKLALLDEKKYPTEDGKLTVYEMTREQLREVKRILNEKKQSNVIEHSKDSQDFKLNVKFKDRDTLLYKKIEDEAKEKKVKPEAIVRLALKQYFELDSD